MSIEHALVEAEASRKKQYTDLCQQFDELKTSVMEKYFSKAESGYLECPHCGSYLNCRQANSWWRWRQAECLVCYGSMLPVESRRALKKLADARDKLANDKVSRVSDPFFEMRHISKTSKPKL